MHLPVNEEPAFESPFYENGAVERLRQSVPDLPEEMAVGIKRANYLAYEPAAERIAREYPGALMIFVLRHPSDRAVSAYLHYCQYGHVPVLPVTEALQRLLDGEDLGSPRASEILAWGRYAQHLERFRSFFSDEKILVIGSSDLRLSPLQVVARVAGTLGVSGQLRNPPPQRSNVGPRSVTEMRLKRAMHQSINIFDSENRVLVGTTRQPLRLGAGLVLRESARVAHRLAKQKSHKLILGADVRERLDLYFSDDIQYVARTFGLTM